MKKKKTKKDDDLDFDSIDVKKLVRVPDFLPPPHEIAKAKTTVIVTIGLDSETINFFKKEAEKRGGKYQRMMREVLKRYADHYGDAA